jgi:exonuclease SbcD
LFKELPNLLEVEFHTPEAEGRAPSATGDENLDWIKAYAEYRRATARETSPDLLAAFRQVYEEVHALSGA